MSDVERIHLDAITRIAAGTFDLTELIGASEALARSDPNRAADLYRRWILRFPGHPLQYVALFNASLLMSGLGGFEEARIVLEAAIALKPDFHQARLSLGGVLERLGARDKAVMTWLEAGNHLHQISTDRIQIRATALKQIARVFESVQNDPVAEDYLRQVLDVDPTQRDVIQHWLAIRQRQCIWPLLKPLPRLPVADVIKGMSPLTLAYFVDEPMLQLAAAFNHIRAETPRPERLRSLETWQRDITADPPRLRIGYLSSDLRQHAIGFLMAEMFGLHDRSRVEVIVYYCGIPSTDHITARIQGTVDRWVDISGMDDGTAANAIMADGVHILVDVNGLTRDARTRMLAMRPAPIIVNWLGFPGTMGSPFHDYIIADPYIVPPGSEIHFSETVARLPCYQPNDRQRAVSPQTPTRAEAGLPEEAVVFCCFNGQHKLTPHHLARWAAILRAVPDGVLWMLIPPDETGRRMRDHLAGHGIDPSRLIFAEKRSNADHLARYALADLFLDTYPYGAHTTASDALWMGVPVLTMPGRSFASRVCASLVRAAGLGELVCDDPATFVARGIELGRNAEARRHLRDRLLAMRDTSVLFDTPLLVRSLEGLYADMWATFRSGRQRRPDLTNLDAYLEVGMSRDLHGLDRMSDGESVAFYRDGLARIDAYTPLLRDRRLWAEEAAR
jgi:predicted O-linked N-acetylglucosamine transferase (SPINDLY family)